MEVQAVLSINKSIMHIAASTPFDWSMTDGDQSATFCVRRAGPSQRMDRDGCKFCRTNKFFALGGWVCAEQVK